MDGKVNRNVGSGGSGYIWGSFGWKLNDKNV